MKKIIALILCLCLFLCACSAPQAEQETTVPTTKSTQPPSTTKPKSDLPKENAEPPKQYSRIGNFDFPLLDSLELSISDLGSSDAYYIYDPERLFYMSIILESTKEMEQWQQDIVLEVYKEPYESDGEEYILFDSIDAPLDGFPITFPCYAVNESDGDAYMVMLSAFTDTQYIYRIEIEMDASDGDASVAYFGEIWKYVKYYGPEAAKSAQIAPSTGSGTASGAGTKENQHESGMYKVGTDLPAGEYMFVAESKYAYVCASEDSNQNEIIENEIFDNCLFMTVSDGQYLEASDCIFVNAADYSITKSADGTVKPGMYRVGIDIAAGEYKITAQKNDYGYYSIYNSSEIPYDIVDNDLFENSSYVTVSDGQYLFIRSCTAVPVK